MHGEKSGTVDERMSELWKRYHELNGREAGQGTNPADQKQDQYIADQRNRFAKLCDDSNFLNQNAHSIANLDRRNALRLVEKGLPKIEEARRLLNELFKANRIDEGWKIHYDGELDLKMDFMNNGLGHLKGNYPHAGFEVIRNAVEGHGGKTGIDYIIQKLRNIEKDPQKRKWVKRPPPCTQAATVTKSAGQQGPSSTPSQVGQSPKKSAYREHLGWANGFMDSIQKEKKSKSSLQSFLNWCKSGISLSNKRIRG